MKTVAVTAPGQVEIIDTPLPMGGHDPMLAYLAEGENTPAQRTYRALGMNHTNYQVMEVEY